ncbi:BON domain-containing protein [Spirulina sp. 06S082]|uniref:BON domain-containing protein n=1 Tax=Spirulina sp. 06S082 TaxID=3110248 RepID=UPI002B1F1FEA|nr:BON domain-containing protein [Spirulina sp. 06S082]MEA5468735.1 BON domain-containing protein [Spirulina sp. 06S082]
MSENLSPQNPKAEAEAKTESSPSSPQDPEQLEGLFNLMSDLQIALANSPNPSKPENLTDKRKRKVPPPPPPPSLMKARGKRQEVKKQEATGNRQEEYLDREELEEFLQTSENDDPVFLPPLPSALSELEVSAQEQLPLATPDDDEGEIVEIQAETIAESPQEKFPSAKKSSSLSAWLYGEEVEETEETVERLRLLLLDLLLEENLSANNTNQEAPSFNKATQRQIAKIDRKLHDPATLGKLIFPVFGELLQRKIAQSPQEVIEIFVPLIDLMIGERGREDKAAMSKALAGVIPGALSKQIGDAPDEVIQAIAPAIGRSIKEQVRLDKDAMVDALYPVIGNTISKYMGEIIKSINKQVEDAFSLQGIYRKFRARIRGVSEAELILTQSVPFAVQAAFLIHKDSGLVIAEAQKADAQALEADMMAGMLTAIRSFASECVPQEGKTSELTEVDYESFQIVMEVAGYCYIATVTQGEPPAGFYTKLRNTLSAIILNYSYGELIEKYNGDPSMIPRAVYELLESLINNPIEEVKTKKKRRPFGVLAIALFLFIFVGIPWGFSIYRQQVARGLERQVMAALLSNSELAFYRINAEAKRKTVILSGQVPSDRLRQQAENIAVSLAPSWQLRNEIVTVGLPTDPDRLRQEIQRQSLVFNQLPGVKITARYDETKGNVIVEGGISQNENSEKIVETFEKIPGVNSVLLTLNARPVPSQERVCFDRGGITIARQEINNKLLPLADYLKENPDLKLRIIGHVDNSGEAQLTEDLAPRRAVVVRQVLRNAGIASNRLETTKGDLQLPPGVTQNDPLWVNRCVRFEEVKMASTQAN